MRRADHMAIQIAVSLTHEIVLLNRTSSSAGIGFGISHPLR
jgi:hypothetical protein